MIMKDTRHLVIDNGGYDMKIGDTSSVQYSLVPNAIARAKDRKMYIGKQIETSCRDYASLVLRRPMEKGQLTNWESEHIIWDKTFQSMDIDPSDYTLTLTHMPFALSSTLSNTDQIVFEEYNFTSYYRCPAQSLVPWSPSVCQSQEPKECALVVDSGFSATHIVPVIRGEIHWPSVKRIDVGGKLITNLLKETISFRHYNMMDETYLINQIKHACCFVSTDLNRDMALCHRRKNNPLSIDYVLPNYSSRLTGYIRNSNSPQDDEQVLTLSNERFLAPEVLFHPSHIGLKQSGISETIIQSLQTLSPEIQSLMLSNILLVGGNSKLANFKQRIQNDLRPLAPSDAFVNIVCPDDPIGCAWMGGKALSESDYFDDLVVSREDYFEYGANACIARFKGSSPTYSNQQQPIDDGDSSSAET